MAFGAILSVGLGTAHAEADDNVVLYDPLSQGVTAVLPTSQTYIMHVTAPLALAGPATVTLRLVPISFPLGDAATAATYVQFSTRTLTFTSPGQTIDVTVSMNFPESALSPDVPSGAYMYQIYSDGWPSYIMDFGASISAGVRVPSPTAGNAPTVTITSPADGATLSFASGQLPASIPFTFTAVTDDTSPAITSVSAAFGTSLGMTTTPVVATGLNSASVAGSGSFTVDRPGTYLLQVSAVNSVGTATDTNTVVVTITAPPPTVTITSPTPGYSTTYRLGGAATVVNFTFSATAGYGAIRTLTAQVDGQDVAFSAAGLNSATATGSIPLSYTTDGAHAVTVTATDDNTGASAQSNFSITLIEPLPAVTITGPAQNQVFTIPANATTMPVNYSFQTTVQNGFGVDFVSATLDTAALSPTTTGFGSSTATSLGTLTLGPGTYTLTATGGSVGKKATTSVSFTVKSSLLPPSVVINTPPEGYTLAIVPGTTTSIPLTFTGTSNNATTVITQLTATVDGNPVTVTATNLNHTVATGTATLAVTAAGTHHIVVTAKDSVGPATATRDFTITFLTPHKITGLVFLDIDGDGCQDGADYGLGMISVKLFGPSCQVLATTTTQPDGTYSFSGLYPGNYVVVTCPFNGLIPTTWPMRCVSMASADVTAAPIGYRLDFCAIGSMCADGYTIGYWKNNLSKAVSGKTSGIQVSAGKLSQYTSNIAQFALTPFDNVTMKSAVATMSSTSSKPADLLAKQLLASEYNYQNGAYLNGNATLTYAFLSWGEAVLQKSSCFSSTYILWAKDWFDAYNNSHGGVVGGP
jgi:hypothetical protein